MSTLFFAPPGWNHTTNIYEVNLRQYTAEGIFAPTALSLKSMVMLQRPTMIIITA
ncbi:hypothetical protein [Flavihumibacter profundi]|uniref:hypothetical protein n=1 Tax=Flavihumibacter profundi TaxID=2716883 RepID=UPI001CC82F6F|nr:hypothetical protein [Flavihumibacter profundi]MBZ5857259.1 hypothetical protein [Flavihumibacter profundi]